MPQGLFRFAKTYFKPTAPPKNSSAMVGHPSYPFHSNSFYTTRLLNTGYYLSLTHNPMVKQSSLSNQPKESWVTTQLRGDCWTMAPQQEPPSNTRICPSKILSCPQLNSYSTAGYMTLYHPNPHSTSHMQIG